MNRQFAFLTLLGVFASTHAAEPALREAIQDEHAKGAETWIYNNLDRAFAGTY